MNISILGYKLNILTIVIAGLLGCIIGSTLLCSCLNVSVEEAFTLLGAPVGWKLGASVPGDVWDNSSAPASDNKFAALENNTAGQVPLPEGEMNFFYDNKFDGSCCFKPQSYSSSSGCACMSVEQVKYLNARGGNNV